MHLRRIHIRIHQLDNISSVYCLLFLTFVLPFEGALDHSLNSAKERNREKKIKGQDEKMSNARDIRGTKRKSWLHCNLAFEAEKVEL